MNMLLLPTFTAHGLPQTAFLGQVPQESNSSSNVTATRLHSNDFTSDECGYHECDNCCSKWHFKIGKDGCSSGGDLDCVDGKCVRCGDEGNKCCDDKGKEERNDGCYSTNNLDCWDSRCT